MRYKHFSIFLLFSVTVLLSSHLNTALARICDEKSIHSYVRSFNKLKDCSVIEGKLVISLMHNATKEDFDKISFPMLTEITDFLLVYQVDGLYSLGRLFPNLTVIRGQKLFTDRYALYVSDANHLEEIGLHNLASIGRGLVAFENNPQLCYATSIDWNYLTNDRSGNEFKNNKAICNVCSEQCPKTNVYDSKSTKAKNKYLCWSEQHCQRFCKNCESRSCYKTENSKTSACCPDECMGSCYTQQLTIPQINRQQPLPNRTVAFSGEQGEIAHICTICRYAELQDGMCANRCPVGHYRYRDRRCVTKEECIKNSKIYKNQDPRDRKDPILFKPVDMDDGKESVCVEHCPDGFMINPENGHSCVKCGNKCYQQCETKKVIDSLAASEKYKKCTVVKGDLIISIQENSPDLMQSLTENLGSIEMITGYLRITKSYALQTLSFFRSLREIQGQTLDRKDYSLLVIDNANLQELFPWNQSMNSFNASKNNATVQVPQLKLGRGRVYFQLNPKLCLNKIYELSNYTNIKNFSEPDVSDLSNGDKAACIIEKIDVTLEESYSDKLKISWTHFKAEDFRTLLSYDIYYKESKDQNISSQFDNRDFCNSNGWTYAYHDVNTDELLDNKLAVNIFTDLKAATQYAFFIKANVLINRTKENAKDLSKTGQSDIVYFRTKPSQPMYPEKLTLTPGVNEIEADWSPPLWPNGKIEYYRVTVEKKSPDEEASKLHCEDTIKETYNTNAFLTEEQPAKEKSSNETEQQASCRCSAAKTNLDEDMVTKRMNIENNLHNLVYYKRDSNAVLTINQKYLNDIDSNELRINLNSTKFKEQLKNVELNERQKEILRTYDSPNNTGRSFHMKLDEFRAFNFNVDQLKKLELNVTNLAKIGLDKATIAKFDLSDPEQKLFETYGDFYRQKIKEAAERRVKRAEELEELEDTRSMFRRWIKRSVGEAPIGNSTQRRKSAERVFVRSLITYDTRVKIDGLEHYTEYIISVSACQNISANELTPDEQCSSNTTQFMYTLPVAGANAITNVTVDSKKISEKNEVLINWSEPDSPNGPINSYKIDYKLANSDNKFSTICVPRHDYKAINGHIIKDLQPGLYSFRIIAQSDGSKGDWTELQTFEVSERYTMIMILIGLGTLLIVGSAISALQLYRYKKKQKTLYASVNPDYIEYEPDEWEIDRDDVKFDPKNELGKGNYGIVYRGEYKLKSGEIIPVAVKTSNSSSSDQERYQFLKEASTMKQIRCYHVISLIGVVSRGIPVLVLLEMMEIGDLRSYLKKMRPPDNGEIVYRSFEEVGEGSDETAENKKTPNSRRASRKQNNNNKADANNEKDPKTQLSIEQLFLWALQIADGMAYLAANKFVHRDLAARNCLLSADLVIKVGDFGMTRDIYSNDYYKKTTRGHLPVRWTSPEALRDGVYTTFSDVWSFGVVLYEMITLGTQPYQGLSNDQVLKFITTDHGRMEKPMHCPDNFYNIMELCWTIEPKRRPSFKEIVQLLLPYVGEEAIEQLQFREHSFYFEDLKRQQMKPDEQNEANHSKREFKKDYLNDKDQPPDDGSDRPLTETEKSDLMDSTFIQYNNNSNTSSENHQLSDFTVRGDRADDPMSNHQQSSEFLENGSATSLSGTDSNDKDDLNKPILVKQPEQVIVQIHPLNGQQESRKSRQESMSCQSSSSASESNGENFENLMDADSNAPLNGTLANGNIMLNS